MTRVLVVAWQRFLGAGLGGYNVVLRRGIHTGSQRLQEQMENTESVASEVTTNQSKSDFSLFPPVPGQGSSLTWGGKKYEDIPIAHIKATYNNTHIQVISPENLPFARTSCGTEGFRNAKKATAIAAQTAGIAAAAVKSLRERCVPCASGGERSGPWAYGKCLRFLFTGIMSPHLFVPFSEGCRVFYLGLWHYDAC
uniref:Mitochondrial ribosomal protein S11 n=1 Tax=Gopherus evgoodei TaxID=1825980 RepID=A0A8C4Y554_9SAUR